MPSDQKKRRDAKKKEAAKKRGGKKDGENGVETNGTNGASNGASKLPHLDTLLVLIYMTVYHLVSISMLKICSSFCTIALKLVKSSEKLDFKKKNCLMSTKSLTFQISGV